MARIFKPIAIGCLDRPRKILFNHNALADVEEETGENPFQKEFWRGMSPRRLRACLWAALRHEDGELSLADAGNLIAPDNLAEITQKLIEAFNAHLAEPKTGEKGAEASA